MDCEFDVDDNGFVCRHCGRKVLFAGAGLRCPTRRGGLGDMVAAGLSAVGITPERVSKAIGVQDCGCKKRQARLNELGRKLGIGGKDA